MSDQHHLLHFTHREHWRAWLESHHGKATEAWLVLLKAKYSQGRLSLDEAVEEALCFGWIDGRLKPLDRERYALRFTPRAPRSIWSVRNIARVRSLTKRGLMTPAGLEKVAQGRQSRQWDAALARERTEVIPRDLSSALRRRKGALAGYRRLSNSRKKMLLHWLATAKTPETREKRVSAIVSEAAEE